MVVYSQFQALRSDGLPEIVTRTGVKEQNRPTAAQQSDIPDANGVVDCYKKLEDDDPRVTEWKRKLGGMYMIVLGQAEHAKQHWLLAKLPDGYELWDHIKYTPKGSNQSQKGKHAGKGYDRQDAYLYGHPHGRKKRFRSPADFFPHLLWLTMDVDGDPRNCPCKLCSPDGAEGDEEMNVEKPEPKKETKVALETPGKPDIKQFVAPKSLPAVQALPTVQAQPPKTISQPTGPRKSKEQEFDSQAKGPFIYRPGELVWFNKGPAWGLGVISKRQINENRPRYLVQQLSHPFSHPPYKIMENNDQLRPWLAWSTPSLTHPAIQDLTYEQVQWDAVIRGEFGNGDPEVDSSILAARLIDSSYSLFDRQDTATPAGEAHFNGMFLGAEKIWVGEPVRLRVPSDDIVVMIIHRLIEHPQAGTSAVTFVGDIYKFVEMPMPYRSRAEWPTPDLPPRMVADLRFRNEVADDVHRAIWCEWRLLEPAARRGLSDVKGRWYETQILLPILKGEAAFRSEIAQGIAADVSKSMNGRGDRAERADGQRIPFQSFRKQNRKSTLGRAVPPNFVASRGLDGPPADNDFPDQNNQMQGMNNFMDLS
ncbi:hypothetical protein BP5796_05455 [Coleophoma crateriformis]|uniref:Cryptic loci regulator 2 N-terminal domain-containing protein n=1 Tax=Coleophoma crateriformis TaxID=565419 RepID=A0A3D8S373_9HELO|nr:hypothetical protein BP5796_05455 [Coleophoma crateriformis]